MEHSANPRTTESHLFQVLERFRPDLQSPLFQQLPLWYMANYLCLKWKADPPGWLNRMNYKYITWIIVQEFLPTSPQERKSVEALLKRHRGDAPQKGRHSNPGTAAGDELEAIRAFLSYKFAELVNHHHKLGLKAQDLKIQISRHLGISLDTLKARRARAKRYFVVAQTNSDVIIFGVDVKGIEKALTGKSRSSFG